jgi:hypothetical protein
VFALVEIFRGEPHGVPPPQSTPIVLADSRTELVWTAITAFLDSVQSVWFENAAVVRAVTAFRRVCLPALLPPDLAYTASEPVQALG